MIISWLRGQRSRAFASAVIVSRHKAPGMPAHSIIGSHHKLALDSIDGDHAAAAVPTSSTVGLEGGLDFDVEM